VLIDCGDDSWERLVLPAARAMGVRLAHRLTGLALSHVADLLRGRATSRPTPTRMLITLTVAEWAAADLTSQPRRSRPRFSVMRNRGSHFIRSTMTCPWATSQPAGHLGNEAPGGKLGAVTDQPEPTLTPDTIVPCGWPGCEVPVRRERLACPAHLDQVSIV
jgi:hypothetical protein